MQHFTSVRVTQTSNKTLLHLIDDKTAPKSTFHPLLHLSPCPTTYHPSPSQSLDAMNHTHENKALNLCLNLSVVRFYFLPCSDAFLKQISIAKKSKAIFFSW